MSKNQNFFAKLVVSKPENNLLKRKAAKDIKNQLTRKRILCSENKLEVYQKGKNCGRAI